MKVTPIGKKFGSYKPGDHFILPDKAAAIFIRAGKLAEVVEVHATVPQYQTRMMGVPAPAVAAVAAPYGMKSDGTPKKRPGRAAAGQSA